MDRPGDRRARVLVEKNASSGIGWGNRGLGADGHRRVVDQLDVFGRHDRAGVAVDFDLELRGFRSVT